MQFKALFVATAIMFLPFAAQAQEMQPATACKEMDKSLPAELSAWTQKSDLASATRAAELGKARLVPGQAATVTLHHTPDVTYVAQPAKPGGSVSYGGLLDLNIKKAGTYRIGLSAGAWLDVVKNKKLLLSTAHGHGPDCSTLRKIVDFPLQAGHYVVQVSANADPAIAIMIWPQS